MGSANDAPVRENSWVLFEYSIERFAVFPKKENLRLGKIAEPWKHILPDVVDVGRCDIMGVPNVDIRHKSRDEILSDMIDQGYQIRR